ncbi:MAG TPA: hypothetical protein DGK91_11055 [Clostridium sp.]|nr:hypothetical protein [Clostridium sp.]
MEVSELRKNYDDGKELEIKVKKRISTAAMSLLVKDVVDNCLKINDDGLLECDYVMRKLSTDIWVMFYFAGLEFPGKDNMKNYDWLVENGIVDMVYDQIDKKYMDMILEIIDREINQRIALTNSVEASVAKVVMVLEKGIDAVIKKLPSKTQISNLIKESSKEVKNFDPNKLQVLSELLGEVNKQ